MIHQVLVGDARDVLPTLPDQSVQMCVTSPPYFGLRDYGHEDQIGLEATVEDYVRNLVAVFREVKRVLRDDGTLFLNLGDTYFSTNGATTGGASPKSTLTGGGGRYRAGSKNEAMFNQSARAVGVPGYGTSGTGESGSQDRGSSSQSRDGEHRGFEWSRTIDTGSHPALVRVLELSEKTRVHTEELLDRLPSSGYSGQRLTEQSSAAIRDRLQTAYPVAGTLLDALASTMHECAPLLQDYSRLTGLFSAYRQSLRAFVDGAPVFARMLDGASETPDYTADSASLCAELAHHSQCIASLSSTLSAWFNPPKVQPQCTTLKPKDLIGIPWRVAFALQADGWWLRQDIIWHKPNPMPESVRDRCTKSHEYIFLFSKQPRYYYDKEAIAEPTAASTVSRLSQPTLSSQNGSDRVPGKTNGMMKAVGNLLTRNRRSVWTITTKPYKGAHFAVFPPEIPELCILAGSSERGQCRACGTPWVRVVERQSSPAMTSARESTRKSDAVGINGRNVQAVNSESDRRDIVGGSFNNNPRLRGGGPRTAGWAPSCQCEAGDPVPQTVLDPFGGSGTTAQVADKHGRHSILVELNPDNEPLIRERLRQPHLKGVY